MSSGLCIADYRYLVVDDDVFTCDLIGRLLRKHGAKEIITADDGSTAIELLKTFETFPDIIICDLNMPELDGVEFLRYLSQEFFTGGLILISGSDKVILNAVKKLGQSHFLTVIGTIEKPFEPETLLSHISKYDGLRRSSAAEA